MDLIWNGKRVLVPGGGLHLGWVEPTPPPPPANGEFKMEIATTTNSQSITIPHSQFYTFNYTVDYGDSSGVKTVTAYNDPDCTHVYANPGTYTITISGTCQSFRFNGTSAMRTTVKKILDWGTIDLQEVNFWGCSNLTEIASANQYSFINVEDGFQNSFFDCTSLTTIGVDLFRYAPITYLLNTFAGCDSLTTVPADLFKYNTGLTSLDDVFGGCNSFATIPTDLFRYNTQVTALDNMFSACPALSSIPADLFKYNTLVTSFNGTFAGCTSLTTIPAGLFRYNTAVTNFGSCFDNCSGLQTLPTGLFQYNTLVSGFISVFGYCTSLTAIPNDMFSGTTVASPMFRFAFYGCSSVAGNAPDMWNRYPSIPTFNKASCFGDCVGLSNYSDAITNGWA